jgi:hypothetical protein
MLVRLLYWQLVNCRLGVIATLVNGPAGGVSAIGGFEFTSAAEQVLVVIPSTA